MSLVFFLILLMLVAVIAIGAGVLAGRLVLGEDGRVARWLVRRPRLALASACSLPACALLALIALALHARAQTGAWPRPFSWQFSEGSLPVAIEALPSKQGLWPGVLIAQLALLAALMSWGIAPVVHAALRRRGLRPSGLALAGWAASYLALIAFMYADPFQVVRWLD